MKYLLIIVLLMVACKKETVPPVTPPEKVVEFWKVRVVRSYWVKSSGQYYSTNDPSVTVKNGDRFTKSFTYANTQPERLRAVSVVIADIDTDKYDKVIFDKKYHVDSIANVSIDVIVK